MQEISSSSDRTLRLIDKLTQWIKKPNLEHNLSTILDSYAIQSHEDSEIPHSASVATTNFVEAGLFLQSSTIVYAKQVDLLYKNWLKYNENLLDLLRTNRENESTEEQKNVSEPKLSSSSNKCKNLDSKTKKVKAALKEKQESAIVEDEANKKIVKTENESREKNVEEQQCPETPRDKVRLRIQNILNRIVTNPKLQDLDLGILSDDCIGATDENHPLHPIFVMNGDELNIAKDLFTVNDIELTGLCWRMLYQLERKLNSTNTSTSAVNIIDNSESIGEKTAIVSAESTTITSTNSCNTSTNNELNTSDKTSEINISDKTIEVSISDKIVEVSANAELKNTTDVTANKSITPLCNEKDTNISNSVYIEKIAEANRKNERNENVQSVELVCKKELRVLIEPLPKIILSKYLKTSEIVQNTELLVEKESEVYVQDIKINLFRFTEKILTRKKIFTLPSAYLLVEKSLNLKSGRYIKQRQETTKRKLNEETEEECIPLKMLKSYDLNAFEDFSYEYNVQAGILPPKPTESVRKSIDARSDRSFPCPVTPDSGRFSLSCGFDSEWENTDTDVEQATSQYHIDDIIENDGNDNDGARSIHAENDVGDEDSCMRPDSGMESASLFDAGYESDRTIEGLKQIFPNITKNPQMLSLAKEIINTTKPPESENYMEWKRFIDNKTAGEKEFDIHEFGTNILNTFPSNSAENVIAFEKIVGEKKSEDVARYFVSTLQLANTENIEIIEQYPGQIRRDSIKLKFLTDTRHHETLQATPGLCEEQFISRLESRHSGIMLQSTPHKNKFRRIENGQSFSSSDNSGNV